MKKIAQIIFSLLLSVSIVALANAQTDNWIRVTSDNGEFSIEVPTKHDFFYDADGFSVSKDTSSHNLKRMHLFSAFHEKTLLSFECYEAGKGGFDAVFEIDKYNKKSSEVMHGSIKVKQIIEKNADFYSVRQYFRSKKFIYILTAASRDGETAAVKRFLESLVFKPDAQSSAASKSVFSSLKISNVNLELKEDPNYKSPKSPASKPKDDTITPLLIICQPRASYIDAARMRNVQGTIAMKIMLNESGFIPKFEILKSLPEGLLRQAFFSAMRLRFLPQEKSNKPVTVIKTLEYHFTLY